MIAMTRRSTLLAGVATALAVAATVSSEASAGYAATMNNRDTAHATTQYPSIDVGKGAWNVVVSKDGQTVYTLNLWDRTVSKVDVPSHKVIATIPTQSSLSNEFTPLDPSDLAVTPDGAHVYVTHMGNRASTGEITVIDTRTDKVVHTITKEVDYPGKLIITPDGRRAYFISNFKDVKVLDLQSNKVTGTIQLDKESTHSLAGVAASPDGEKVYVTDRGGNNSTPRLSVINTGTHVVNDVEMPRHGARGAAVPTADGKYVYVRFNDNTVWGHSENAPEFTVKLPNITVNHAAASPTKPTVYYTNGAYYNSITAITHDDAGHATIRTIALPERTDPAGIAVSPRGDTLYVTSTTDDKLVVLPAP